MIFNLKKSIGNDLQLNINISLKEYLENPETIALHDYGYNYDYQKVIDKENLINWYFKYPPTKLEYAHNNLVAQIQKKRNIFIDMNQHKKYNYLILKIFG